MKNLPKNVWVLTVAQPLLMSVNSLVVMVGGIIGAALAPVENLATLPVALIILGTASSVVPTTLLMRKWGRKKIFLLVCLLSVLLSNVAAYAIYMESFYFFCVIAFALGITSATVMQFRFAAIESVSTDLIPRAASTVLVGGMVAAYIGPEIAVFGKDIFSQAYVGSFVLLSGLFLLAFFILFAYQNVQPEEKVSNEPVRPLKSIISQNVFWVAISSAAVGYMIMSFIMTATPVSMHMMDGHALHQTKWVIQSHIIAMFLPSLFTGNIIQRIGAPKVMIMGLVIYGLCVVIGYSGHALNNYWVSLILLGLGWNFLFIGGTTILPLSYRPSERFKVQAMNEAIVMGSQALASLSAGWVVFELGWELLLLLTVPVVLVQLVVIYNYIWRDKKRSLAQVST